MQEKVVDRRALIQQALYRAYAVFGSYLMISCRTLKSQSINHKSPKTNSPSETPVIFADQQIISHTHGFHQNNDYQKQHKLRNFDYPYPEDIYIAQSKKALFQQTSKKLEDLKHHVGHGHFNILTFDEAIKISRYQANLAAFTKSELDFLYEMFQHDPKDYGFFGEKVTKNINHKFPSKDIIKVPHTGHYLFKEQYEQIYLRLKKDVGQSLILTSGVRGIIKQMHLFFSKAISANGNLSQASRSLAPPGYSFHAVGDFDVGKKGLGRLNFTDRFSQTDEFKKLIDLGYIDIRYPLDNPFGVRFEPWHIEGFKRQGEKCHRCG